ncbi:MAG: SPOR domain-containing protein, partial [Alphaproteobacteria bacterium]|nr:SPOR domain-containing protein [Alphaproteobacteria bacterium]
LEPSTRPKRPWLLLGASVIVIALASYIIIRVAGTESQNVVTINLDMPVVATSPDVMAPAPVATPEQPVPEPTPVVPVRAVEDRAAHTFQPAAPVVEPPRPRPVAAAPAAQPAATAPRPAAPAATAATGWMVQIGSFPTRERAEVAQQRIVAAHRTLIANRQFVILPAQVNNQNVFRLRVTGFTGNAEANDWCRQARTNGLDCFVTR